MADEIFESEDMITLTDEDGVEIHFNILGSCEVEGIKYLALIPLEDNEAEEYVILKLTEDEDGDEVLVTIDDDDEFDKVADAFEDEFMGEIDHDELDTPEE